MHKFYLFFRIKLILLFVLFIIEKNNSQGCNNKIVDSLGQAGTLYYNQSDLDNFLKIYKQILEIGEKLNDTCILCSSKSYILVHYRVSGDTAQFNKLMMDINKNCLAHMTAKEKSNFYYNRAYQKRKLKQIDSIKYYLERSFEEAKLSGDSITYYSSYSEIGLYYTEIENYKEAIKYFDPFYYYAKNVKDSNLILRSGLKSILAYSKTDSKKSLELIHEIQPIARSLNDKNGILRLFKYQSYVHNELGQYQLAYERSNQMYNYFRDTFMPDQNLARLNSTKAQYETEKKEAMIAFQNEKLLMQRKSIRLSYTISFLILCAGILLAFLYKKLQKSNRDKEFLIKEIHHRVKNNLQIISSLLHLQSRYLKDPIAIDVLREGQNRVDAMGLIHQKLYLGNNIASVEMQDYLLQMINSISDSFGAKDVKVIVDSVKIKLNADTAIPLGLIINELITNSFKYAFPNQSGNIWVKLFLNDSGHIQLEVKDNGVGISINEPAPVSKSFGLQLVQSMCKKLNASYETSTDSGYCSKIIFQNTNIIKEKP